MTNVLQRAASAPASPAKGVFFALVLALPLWLAVGLAWLLAGAQAAGVMAAVIGALFLSAGALGTRKP